MEQPVAYEVSVQGEQVSDAGVMRGSASYEMASGEIARVRDFVREFLTSAQTVHGWD
ncbi:hypothetical protein J7F02_29060 [Streptomyces sp. ISL-112]|uniref:hypothetical protein n=1 Tax=unclassified Streptomyces TaxID=2593676 RepID=UPI001BE7E6CC|nr:MULTISPECIES: hypothetical protein [unclassified Streptomyces]MBT2429547.1 hypothetical protein [Streptomyces sp. ISL-112]MBT2462822.1 hypothetical protein [Streptomyces sp. ISL-63]